MLFINFKIYQQTFGDGAVKLAKVCQEVAKKTGIKIIPIVSALDLRAVKKICDAVWVQHVDDRFEGKHTGWISPLAVASAGADGVLLNHSEHQIPPGKIRQIISRSKNLKFMICVKTKGQIKNWVKKLRPRPNLIAYEVPELIGTGVSVIQVQPGAVQRVVKLLPKHKIIIGAGIKSAEDIKQALKLGATGVLVSSDIVTAENPKKELTELAEAFK